MSPAPASGGRSDDLSRPLVGGPMIYIFPAPSWRSDNSFPAPSRRFDDLRLSVPGACKAGRRWFSDFLKWACRGNTEFCISRMSRSSFVFVSFILSRVLESGGVLGFCVLPSTPEGTLKVPERYPGAGSLPGGHYAVVMRGCHRYEVRMSFCWGHVAPFFFFLSACAAF